MKRRGFLKAAAALSASSLLPATAFASGAVNRRAGASVRIGLNAYSFNRPLLAGTMTIEDVIDFCAEHEVAAVDLTGYYFPGYPDVPSDEFIYKIKRKAFVNGVTISGTGVRNDFALTDASSRKGHIQLVKDWVEVGAKLGSDVMRVFSGREIDKSSTFDKTLEWMIPAFQECAEHGKKHGVIIGLQHHDDFLKTAAETIRVIDAVNSEWFSVVLDVGSVRQNDPYEEIQTLVPYACTWQIKEQVWYGEKATPIDLPRVKQIIDKVGYRGFLPIEALGKGEPREIVATFLNQVKKVFA